MSALDRLAGRRAGALVLFCLGLAAYAVRAVGWPLQAGRDLDEYLLAYVQLLDGDPVLPWVLLYRTPGTPVVAGGALDIAGGALAEPLLAVLYAASIVAWSAAALAFGRRVALATAAFLLVYPAYALMFHELASEPVTASAFALWALLLVRASLDPSPLSFCLAGLGVGLLALVRPGNVVLLAVAVLPLALAGSWRERAFRSGAFVAAAALPLLAWAAVNGVRYDEWTLVRGGNALVPFYRAFITDRIVAPENGDASQRLAEAVRTRLLTREPYRSYGVTLEDVFSSGSFRIHEDLHVLSDEAFGWDSDYATLREAAIEGIERHPGVYAAGVAETVWQQLTRAGFRTPEPAPPPASRSLANARALPEPTEGQPIPGGQNAWISRPDQAIRQVWTSPTEYRFSFAPPADEQRFREAVAEAQRLQRNLPDRVPNSWLELRLNQLSRWFPRPALWLLVGAVALAIRRPRNAGVLVSLPAAALLLVLLHALGMFADPHFVLPVAPAFVLFGLGALLGERRAAASASG